MDLMPLIANLRLKYNLDCLRPDSLKHLTEVSRYVYETANMNLVSGQPYVGNSAFAHKGGMHVHAVQKDTSNYEHVSPEDVGDARRILVSEMSGASNSAATQGRELAIAQVHLTDYKVRVINSKDETAASVRVIIECKRDKPDGTREIFGTIGVNTNVIDASWQALVDAYEYHLIHTEEAHA